MIDSVSMCDMALLNTKLNKLHQETLERIISINAHLVTLGFEQDIALRNGPYFHRDNLIDRDPQTERVWSLGVGFAHKKTAIYASRMTILTKDGKSAIYSDYDHQTVNSYALHTLSRAFITHVRMSGVLDTFVSDIKAEMKLMAGHK